MNNLTEERWLPTVIGVVVLFVAGTVWTYRDTLISNDPRIIAAVIYGCFTIVGIVVSTLLQMSATWIKQRRERERLATILITEIASQAIDFVRFVKWLKHVAAKGRQLSKVEISLTAPDPTTAYPRLVDKLGLFPSPVIRAIVGYHSSLEGAKRLVDELASAPAISNKLKPTANTVLSKKWEDAAHAGQLALDHLRSYSKGLTHDQMTEIERIIRILVEVSKAEEEHVATGNENGPE